VTTDELRAIPLLHGASDAGLERLEASAGEMTCEAGQVIALQGDQAQDVRDLDGTVSVSGAVDRRARTGSFFGSSPSAPGGTQVRGAGIGHVTCLAIPRDGALGSSSRADRRARIEGIAPGSRAPDAAQQSRIDSDRASPASLARGKPTGTS
jgi:hypothetical protein